MKKLISLLLALTMALSLAACGKSGDGEKPTNGEKRIGEDGRQIVTIGIQIRANIEDMDNNDLTLWLEEQTGYDLQFVSFSLNSSEWRSQVNTMIASGEPLPDFMYAFGWNEDERYTYGSDGYLMDMKPYILGDECADWRARVAEVFGEDYLEENLKYIESPDGAIYTFPYMSFSHSSGNPFTGYINKQWLDNLGLEMPTNWDELVNVLRAFKTQDPNGNGVQDEIPAVGLVPPSNTTTGSRNNDMPNWLLNNFLYLDDTRIFNSENGKLIFPYVTDEYREGLIALHDLVEEGLLSTLCWTMSTEAQELNSMWGPADNVSKLGFVTASMSTRFPAGSPCMYEYQPIIPFNNQPLDASIPATTFFITEDCNDVNAVLDIIKLLASEEGALRMTWGVEGRDWQWEEDDSEAGKGVRVLQSFGGKSHSVHWGGAYGRVLYTSPDNKYHAIRDPKNEWQNAKADRENEFARLYRAAGEQSAPAEVVYKLPYSPEEMESIGNTKTDILIYMKESRAKVATGEMDPRSDEDWNRYLSVLNDMGLENYVAQSQAAWDRFNGK